MSASRSLQVLLPDVPAQRWSCHACTDCCRTPVAFLADHERRRIDEQAWRDRLGMPPYVRVGRRWALNKRDNGACVFLDHDNRCMIHNEFGPEAKPRACRLFPFAIHPVQDAWQATIRFDCPSAARSEGEPISRQKPELRTLVDPSPHVHPAHVVHLRSGIRATPDEINTLTQRFLRWLADDRRTPFARLLGGAEVVTLLAQTRFHNVRGPRLAELLDLLFAAAPSRDIVSQPAASDRQRGLLRQLTFAHAEYLTLTDLRAGPAARWIRRWRQFRDARRFRRGRGTVPSLPDFAHGVPFEGVERIHTAPTGSNEESKIAELLLRYLTVRLSQNSAFGPGYYGWGVVEGLTALWLTLPVIGWLSRLAAAPARRSAIIFDDVTRALAAVDRSASRAPVLGGVSERARAAYLAMDEGLVRLLYAYGPIAPNKAPNRNDPNER